MHCGPALKGYLLAAIAMLRLRHDSATMTLRAKNGKCDLVFSLKNIESSDINLKFARR
jgi:hypothetical protein